MPVLQWRDVDVSMYFQCDGCGFSAPVVVRGRGLATGAFETGGLSERAQRGAMDSARMRCELTPCPRCGRRSFARYRRTVITNCMGAAGFVAFVIACQYVFDASVFDARNVGVAMAIYGSVAALLFGSIGVFALLEVRNAARKVRFVSS